MNHDNLKRLHHQDLTVFGQHFAKITGTRTVARAQNFF